MAERTPGPAGPVSEQEVRAPDEEVEVVDTKNGDQIKTVSQSTQYRHKMKETNKQKYDEYLQKQKSRSKEYKAKVKTTPEKLLQSREKAKLRQRKYREKLQRKIQKEKEIAEKIKQSDAKTRGYTFQIRLAMQKMTSNSDILKKESENTTASDHPTIELTRPKSKPNKPRTRGEMNLQRQKWREAKKKYREKMDEWKKSCVKRKDRDRKRELYKKKYPYGRSRKKINEGYRSKQSMYNDTCKARQALPNTPEKFASVIKYLVKNTTPKKRAAVNKVISTAPKKPKMEDNENGAAETLEIGTNTPTEQTEQQRREAKPNKKTFNFLKNIENKYRTPNRTIQRVKNFFHREDISTPLPQKRYANKYGPGYVMQVTLSVAFTIFKKDFKDVQIGFTKFTTLRPKDVRLLSKRHWNYCVCTICQNLSYKLKTLNNRALLAIGKLDINQLIDIILCSKSDGQRFHQPQCIFKDCERCSNTEAKVSALLNMEGTEESKDVLVTWNHWEREVQNGVPRKVLKIKTDSVPEMTKELVSDLSEPVQNTSFAEHLFIGQWQQKQFSELKTNLPKEWVLLVMDFGKNRAMRFQDEPKSVFFTAQQVTIHPVVLFYHSSSVADLIVRDPLVFLSNDNKHDYH